MAYPRTTLVSTDHAADDRVTVNENTVKSTWRDVVELDHADMPYTVPDVSDGVAADCLVVDTDGTGTYDVYLPTLSANEGRSILLKNVGTAANDVTLHRESTGEEIDGAETKVVADGESVLVVGTASHGWQTFPLGV